MAEQTAPSGGSVLITLGLVAISIVGLSIVDAFLARTERSENAAEANRLSAAGRSLLQQGHPADAVTQYKAALAIDRGNSDYWLALGEAEFAAGELADAEKTLTQLLGRDSNSGPARLALARVLVKEGRITEAVSNYHQAIYGHWPHDADSNRVSVRFELVNLLAQEGSKEELLAELLPLLDVAPDDLAVRMRLGQLFLTAGSAPRAGEIFRDILRQHPQDADAYAGLGESEFVRGNYQTAHSDFEIASNLRPNDAQIEKRLELCTAVLELDPMRRGLVPAEQYKRSLKMLEMATDAIAPCTANMPADDQDTLSDAQKALKAHVAPAQLSSAVEDNLNLAEDVWKIRLQDCKRPPSASEEPLRLVLAKIAQ